MDLLVGLDNEEEFEEENEEKEESEDEEKKFFLFKNFFNLINIQYQYFISNYIYIIFIYIN